MSETRWCDTCRCLHPSDEPGCAVRMVRTDHPVIRWNDAVPIGAAVRYWPGLREGDGIVSRTRTRATLLGGHTPAVWVEGRGDCIALTHIEVIR